MASFLGSVDLNGFSYVLAYDVLSQSAKNNTSTVRFYGILHVTNSYVSWSSGSASVHTSGMQGIGTYYSYGDTTVITRDFTFTHDVNGNASAYIGASISTTLGGGSGSCGGTMTLPKINRVATINTFTGTDISKPFKATYTTKSNGLSYKLRISIPNIKALDTFSNYSSGSEVSLSKSSIDYIKAYTSSKTIQLGGVIETWSGGTKLGESSQIKITCNIRRDMYIRINGAYKRATAYVRVGNTWKEARPHLRVNNEWKEGI